ncbi:MAG TPA: site-2 protease family protein [Planctomycetes bacterium]|nr:site-2 protease family protein [Planctomycetota bacterium]
MHDLIPQISQFLSFYIALIVSIVVHEGAHAAVAYLGGDRTAYDAGQVTLNPIPHMRREPFGTIILPIISFFMMGFPLAFAHAPYDPYWADRHPKRAALMSFAGPGANLLLAALIFGILKLGLSMEWFEAPPPGGNPLENLVAARDWVESGPFYMLAKGLSLLLSINFLLGLFNLVPIPPLDGAGIVEGIFPPPVSTFYRFLRRDPWISILGLLVVFYYGGSYLWYALRWMQELLLG